MKETTKLVKLRFKCKKRIGEQILDFQRWFRDNYYELTIADVEDATLLDAFRKFLTSEENKTEKTLDNGEPSM